MAPRIPPNHYHTIDFTSLALQYPTTFARKLKANGQLDFSDPEAVRQLTIALLHRDFGLTITLPPNRLCPPVPNRFNYIVFLQRLLDSTSANFRDSHDPNRRIVGIDIGTGASAIYPLLGTSQYASWSFFATEIDALSHASAAENIKRNGLEDRIKLISGDDGDVINQPSLLIPENAIFSGNGNSGSNGTKIDFVMTNPPFYGSTAEMMALAKLKARPPNSSCSGSEGEMVYQYHGDLPSSSSSSAAATALHQALATGGEIAFTAQLLHESTSPSLRHRVQWFSAMLGKLSSLPPLINLIHQLHAHIYSSPTGIAPATGANYAVTEFIQGQKTRRWCLAWSWMALRPPMALARGISISSFSLSSSSASASGFGSGSGSGSGSTALEKRLLPAVSEFEFTFSSQSVAAVSGVVNRVMQELVAEVAHHNDHNVDNNNNNINQKEEEGEEEEEEDIIRWQWKSKVGVGLAIFMRDCWSRKARRRRMIKKTKTKTIKNNNSSSSSSGKRDNAEEDEEDDDDEQPALVVKISVKHDQVKAETAVRTRWMQGIDSVLFESFCGWLKRKVETKVGNK